MKKLMRKLIFSIMLLGMFVSAFAAGVAGGSSNNSNVKAGVSSAVPFGAGDPGIAIKGSNLSINLQKGPYYYVKSKKFRGVSSKNARDSRQLKPSDVIPIAGLIGDGLFGPAAEVWYKKSGNIEVVTARQYKRVPPIVPKFGAITIAKVDTGSKVFFGEWSPKVSGVTDVSGKSSNLGMNSAQRTVWYVGENKTTNLSRISAIAGKHAKYEVAVVNKYVPASHLQKGNFYAYFGSKGRLYGQVGKADLGNWQKGGATAKNAKINMSTGKITRGNDFEGQFYGNRAQVIAGVYKPANANDRFAFGGKRTGVSKKKYK